MNVLKPFEKWGRRILVYLLAQIFAAPKRRLNLPDSPKILVIRLDPRVGNLILLTPLLTALKDKYPTAQIDLLSSPKASVLLERHPALHAIIHYEKKQLLSKNGPLRLGLRLRRSHYDLVVDAGNPTDPSLTQAVFTRLVGGPSIGSKKGGFGPFYSHAVDIDPNEHEISMRLQLLSPLNSSTTHRLPSIPQPPQHARLPTMILARPYALLNVGARLDQKKIGKEDYSRAAQRMLSACKNVVIVYGPDDSELAKKIAASETGCQLAPPTSLLELWQLIEHSHLVVSCDTGPMHMAVARQKPTFGIFVSTPQQRYGYAKSPHACVDYDPDGHWLKELENWLKLQSLQ